MSSLLDHWRSLSLRRRIAWGVALTCLLLGAALKPLVQVASPRLAVHAWAARGGPPTDPWGNRPMINSYRAYSSGPDGVWDAGDGDDVLLPRSVSFGAKLVGWSREGFGSTAVILGWLLLASFGSPKAKPTVEIARAALLASLPAVLLGVPVYWLFSRLSGLKLSDQGSSIYDRDAFEELLLVPAPVAATGTVALMCLVMAMWWRFTREPESERAPPRSDPSRSERSANPSA